MATASPASESRKYLSNSQVAAKHRLLVFARDAVDVITSAGGLIVDYATTGWDVQIYLDNVATEIDTRAMRILGIRKHMPSPDFEITRRPVFLVISAELYHRNILVSRLCRTAASRNRTKVAMWGGGWPADLEPGIGDVKHRLSFAAKAFKSQAIGTVGLTPEIADVEYFQEGKRRCRIAEPMLSPA